MSHVVDLKSTSAFFIIPGNPPAMHFYELWKAEILRAAPGAHVIVAVYPTVSVGQDSEVTMNEIAHALGEQLQSFAIEAGAPVTILGHSLGGYFAYKVLQMKSGHIERVHLLYPFLRKPSVAGQQILKFFEFAQRNDFARTLVMKSRNLLGRVVPDLLHVKHEELVASLALAYHEHYAIAQDQSVIQIPVELRDKLNLFYVKGDVWCTATAVEALQKQIRHQEVSEPHAFVASSKHRRSLFQKIIEFEKLFL